MKKVKQILSRVYHIPALKYVVVTVIGVGENGKEWRRTVIDKYNEVEIEADGFITRAETLERINQNKAKPAEECMYPECEKCDKYHGHYCTVPMVVSKQIWRMTEERLWYLNNRLDTIEELVTAKILGSDQ